MTITPERRAGIIKQAEQYPDLYADDLDLLTALEEVEAELATYKLEVELLLAEFKDTNYWKERHCVESQLNAARSQDNWKKLKDLRSQLEKADKELNAVRFHLWCWYPCVGKYGDDGEMQADGIDFKRTDIPILLGKVTTKLQAYLAQRSKHEE